MSMANPRVDDYLLNGCGRCPLGNTPDCKVHRWPEILNELRRIVLECGLDEERKWGVPCYTVNGKNVIILSAFKDYTALSFFKGALLEDPAGILIQPTRNSHADRQIRFTDPAAVRQLEPALREYIDAAVEVEKSGRQVPEKTVSEFEVVPEFQDALQRDPVLRSAFEALTPGRQKGYLLHFAGAKQSKTRTARIEKCTPRILDGIGFHDRF